MFFRFLLPRVAQQSRRCLCWCPGRGYRKNIPISRGNPWEEIFRGYNVPFRAFDNYFTDVFRRFEKMMPPPMWQSAMRSRVMNNGEYASEVVSMRYDKQKFELELNVQNFNQDELQLKLLDDKLVISGKHESKSDEHGFVAREFTREFLVPEDVDTETFSSSFTNEGTLVIRAKVKGAENIKERVINIDREPSSDKKE